MNIINVFLKARMSASVVLCGGGNRKTRGKTPTLDWRPLPCHMPIPGCEPGPQRCQASVLPLGYPGLLSCGHTGLADE